MITQPYVGLRPFKQHDHEIFFGREECVDELTERLTKTNFIAVVSEAYCGKTSLVHCGLETKLLKDTETQWHIANFQPYSNPYIQLATSLLTPEILGGKLAFSDKYTIQELKQVLAYGDLSLHQLLKRNPLPTNHNLLIVCDQFEDIFLRAQENLVAEKFINLLVSSTKPYKFDREVSNQIYIIITMRSNYLDKASLFPRLDKIIRNNIYLVSHLNKKQLEDVILKPVLFIKNYQNEVPQLSQDEVIKNEHDFLDNNIIEEYSKELNIFPNTVTTNKKLAVEEKEEIEIDPKLATFLLDNIEIKGDELPLLQHLLMRMWHISLFGGKRSLTIELYKKISGGDFYIILERHLNKIYYQHLKEDQQVIARNLFRQLIEVTNNKQSSLLYVPVKIAEVAKLAQTSVEEIIKVIETFRKPDCGFLIPAYPEKLDKETLIEFSYESILRYWSKLANWKAEEGEAERNYRELDKLAHQYYEGKGARLQKVQKQTNALWQWSESEHTFNQAWAEHYGCDFNLIERYLLKSKNLFAYCHKYYALPTYAVFSVIIILIIWSFLPSQKQAVSIPLVKKDTLDILYQTEEALILKKEAFYLEKKCNEATIDKPNSTDAWFHCGFWMAYQGKLDEAEEAYQKSIKLDSDNTDAQLQLAKIWVIKKRFDEAEAILNSLLAEDSHNAEILYQLGEILTDEDSLKKSRKRQLRTGIYYYQTALTISPKNDKILSQLGRTFTLLGDHKQAFENLKKAVEINPQNIDAWYNLGNEYIKNAQIDAGIETLKKIIEKNPRNLKYWRILGHLYMKKNQFEKAAKAFTKALGLKPDDDNNWRNLGAALLRKGDLVEATGAFEKAVTLNKYNNINYRNLGDVWMKRHHLKKALKFYNTALEIKVNKINLIKKAGVLTQLNQYKQANNLYKQAVVMKASDWD